MTTTPLPDTIRASIHQEAIDKVSRFFNASFEDALNELLQNARRSHATKVDITIDDGHVTVSDDGDGISDPATLLSFGQSRWDTATTDREDPAGMGIYALANCGATIASQTRDPRAPAWQVILNSDHFNGNAEAPIHLLPASYHPPGTTVSFVMADANQTQVANAARHYPLPVTCNGELMQQANFLADARYVTGWQGIRIGVFRDAHNQSHLWSQYNRRGRINFHGLNIKDNGLPVVEAIDDTWYVKLDIIDCPQLKLVLPARHQVVQTEFVPHLRIACQHAIFSAMMAQDTPPDLPFKQYATARTMGFDYPQASAKLKPWESVTHNPWFWGRQTRQVRNEIDPKAAIVIGPEVVEPPDVFTLERAFTNASIIKNVWQADSRLAGYPWYDALTFVENVHVVATTNDVEQNITEVREQAYPNDVVDLDSDRPDRITFHVHTRRGDEQDQLQIDGDLAFANYEYCEGDDVLPLVTRDSMLTPQQLTQLMMYTLFEPSDDPSCDSAETQEQRWHDEYLHIATAMLETPRAATLNTMARAIDAHVRYLVPPGHSAEIIIEPGKPTEIRIRD